MVEVQGDLWAVFDGSKAPNKLVVVTTNGVVKSNGELVMGAGVALQAKQRYPWLPKKLGAYVLKYGNRPFFLYEDSIVTLPTKYDWKNPSNLTLIDGGLQEIAKKLSLVCVTPTVYMPRPGCGNGGLKWENVKPLVEKYCVGDNYVVVHNGE